jgi:hypothetical protein
LRPALAELCPISVIILCILEYNTHPLPVVVLGCPEETLGRPWLHSEGERQALKHPSWDLVVDVGEVVNRVIVSVRGIRHGYIDCEEPPMHAEVLRRTGVEAAFGKSARSPWL